MNPGSVDGMNYWIVVALLVDGIGRRENAVVVRACFSYQAESFALGLRDKLDYLTHIRLQLLCRVPAGPGWQMGRKVWVNRRGIGRHPSKFWKPGPSADHLSQPEVARATRIAFGGPRGTASLKRCPRSMAPMPAY